MMLLNSWCRGCRTVLPILSLHAKIPFMHLHACKCGAHVRDILLPAFWPLLWSFQARPCLKGSPILALTTNWSRQGHLAFLSLSMYTSNMRKLNQMASKGQCKVGSLPDTFHACPSPARGLSQWMPTTFNLLVSALLQAEPQFWTPASVS